MRVAMTNKGPRTVDRSTEEDDEWSLCFRAASILGERRGRRGSEGRRHCFRDREKRLSVFCNNSIVFVERRRNRKMVGNG